MKTINSEVKKGTGIIVVLVRLLICVTPNTHKSFCVHKFDILWTQNIINTFNNISNDILDCPNYYIREPEKAV